MLLKHKNRWDISESEVTPEKHYLNRRNLMKGLAAGGIVAGAGFFAASASRSGRNLAPLNFKQTPYDPGEALTPEAAVTGYNNFYEFGVNKDEPASNAWRMNVAPWTIEVEGLADNVGTYSFEDLIDKNLLEERIYRLRCVEAWSMVIPWVGVPLSSILKKLAPKTDATYVAFETLSDRNQMPGLRYPVLDWPYVEGLTMAEAMNDLTLMATGLYGKELPNQNGAPLRLVVPWKYGFKSIKSIVKIKFMNRQPPTSWNRSAPREYGFYSNVNPEVDHPRWSQATERRIGEFGRRKTLMFNGYAEQVAHLYTGMDLKKYF